MIDQEPGDAFLLLGRRCGRPPDRRQVIGQGPDRPLVLGRQAAGGRSLPAPGLVLQLPPVLQRFLPAPFQLAGHEPILRLARLELTLRPVRLISRPLQPQLPLPGRLGTLPFDFGQSGQARLQRRRGDGREELIADEVLEHPPGEALVQRLGVVARSARATVGHSGLRPRILDEHPSAASAAPQQPGQERWPPPRRARSIVLRPVGLQPVLVGDEPLPGDVGRQPVADQEQAHFRSAMSAAGPRPAGELPARVGLPVAESVGAGVARVVQQVLERDPVRPPPFQVPPIGPGIRPDGDEDLAGDQ